MSGDHPSRDDVSAIVVSYNTGPALADCLAALKKDEAVSEIILVDNGNPDGAIEAAIEKAGASLRVLSGHGNVGFAAGCNRGAAAATGDYLLFINPDAVISPGGAARLLAGSRSLARPWLMGAQLLDPDGKEQQGSRRADLTPWRAIFEASKLSRVAPGLFPSFNLHCAPLPEALTEIPTLSGACLFLPSENYHALGGMDEGYFLHVEDIDFCRRFRDAGGRVWFDPAVTVTHLKSSSDAPMREVEAHKTRGLIRYFDTHFEKSWPAPARWVLARLLWLSYGLKIFGRR